jgi:hypothetical protein
MWTRHGLCGDGGADGDKFKSETRVALIRARRGLAAMADDAEVGRANGFMTETMNCTGHEKV